MRSRRTLMPLEQFFFRFSIFSQSFLCNGNSIDIFSIWFPEAAILLVSKGDRDLWDNPFADNRIFVVVPTVQAWTNKSNEKKETKDYYEAILFLFRQVRTILLNPETRELFLKLPLSGKG